ncbi:MAG: RNA polymerase sigma factor [Chloroflexi bacterium]|nr:RNA polymerase sigma factor [Chloroflexota bacterium]
MDDQKAIKRLKRGDINGLSALVERYQVRAIRTAYLITQDAALAEDVVQEAFVNVYHSIHSFDTRRPFAPWFIRAVVNRAIKASQRQRAAVPLDGLDDDDLDYADYLTDPEPGPDSRVENAEDEEAVWEALGTLSAGRRAVIVLRFYLEMSEAEIAEQLNIPVGTVKSRLHSAKHQLRERLVQQEEV